MANPGQLRRAKIRTSLRARLVLAALTLSAALAFCTVPPLAAQNVPPQTGSRTAQKPPHPRHPAARRPRRPAGAKPSPTTPPKPQAPAQPAWPVNQKPNPARITWDAHGLQVVADNSSLDQILQEVATDIGAKVTGLSHDERVFGAYGPGPARDVLSKLLNGTGYNVIMIGDRGDGAPRQIELSPGSPGGGPAPVAASPNPPQAAENDSPEEQSNGEPQEPQPPLPMPIRTPFGNGAPPRSPQQFLQQMQQQRMPQQNQPQ